MAELASERPRLRHGGVKPARQVRDEPITQPLPSVRRFIGGRSSALYDQISQTHIDEHVLRKPFHILKYLIEIHGTHPLAN